MAGDSGPMLDTRTTGPAINVDDCSDSYHHRFCYQCEFCSHWSLKADWGPGWSTCPWCHRVERTMAQKRAEESRLCVIRFVDSLISHDYSGNTLGTPLDGCWEYGPNGWIYRRYNP